MLPGLGFSERLVEGKEIFFKTSNEIKRVVSQRIPAFVVANLPDLFTKVIICFPVPDVARIYVRVADCRQSFYYIGQEGEGYRFYWLSKRIRYRYGVEFSPWMYEGYLKTGIKGTPSRTVNYIIENCSAGFSGILLKFQDEMVPEERNKEWFKVYWFDGGSEYDFWRTEHTKIIELIPQREGDMLFWEPRDGWRDFKRKKAPPAGVII
jgi:hypothetical protein